MPDVSTPPNAGREKGDKDEKTSSELVRTSSDLTIVNPHQGSTLLPLPVAAVISTITGVGSLSVRVGTKVGGWGLYAGREATLKSLSVTRSAVEQVLFLAGRDVAARSNSELGQAEAASILEKSMSALYSTISTASFIASTGFYFTEATINSVSGLSIHALSMLNAICGSTESSRAVAAIITLLKNELNKPEAGEVVSYWDIVVAVVGFVLLQRWGRRKTQLDFRTAGGEETIWDTVIDDKGFRADVVGTRRKEAITLQPIVGNHPISFTSPADDDDFEVLERGMLYESQRMELTADDQTRLSDEEIRQRIVSQLPRGARAVITSETLTAKTIKVEIYDADTTHIEAPPGTVMVAERLNHHAMDGNDKTPNQTVVFRTALKRSSSAEIDPHDALKLTSLDGLQIDTGDNEDVFMMKTSPKRQMTIDSRYEQDDNDSESDHADREFQSMARSTGPLANQKKSRKPVASTTALSSASKATSKIPTAKLTKEKSASSKTERGGVIKKALKTLSPTQSVTAMKDAHNAVSRKLATSSKPLPDSPGGITSLTSRDNTVRGTQPISSLSNGHSSLDSPIMTTAPQQGGSNFFTVHENRRDSTMSQVETYSVHSVESRPGSPTFTRTHAHTRTVSGLAQTKSEVGLSVKGSDSRPGSSAGTLHHHQRSKSFVPSFYSMGSKHSGEAIILAPKTPLPRKSIYEDQKMIDVLTSDGKVPGIFPDRHMVKTIRRFARFATASYGSNFLSVMGLTDAEKKLSKSTELTTLDVHHEHSSFSSHTGLPADTILLSSFFDPKGVTGNTQWSPSAISPLIHFISLDHDSKAVVLTCRGTLGFEDVLTDMTCDFDDLVWQGRKYKVHKGIHASARRLLGGSGTRIMATIKATLEEFPDYGLVLCGHSLGGAVAALVAILISEQSQDESQTSFVTTSMPKLLTNTTDPTTSKHSIPPIQLPKGRPIHVYAYGTPATMSEPLRLATRGLITTTVNASDIVPCLSLGTLHDFRTIALHLKHDSSDAIEEVKARVWRRIKNAFSLSASWNERGGPPPPENIAGDGIGEDTWAWSALKTLRAAMINDKLVPPGEVFVVETTRVFDRLGPDVRKEAVFGPDDTRDDRTEKLYRALGRPATRVQFKLIRNVETRFAELRFGRDMFGDHSPGRYEASLNALEKGICED